MAGTTGLRIAERRKRAGLTQRALEEKTGISQSTLSRIERGTRDANMAELISIAGATGSTCGELVGDSAVRDRLQFAGRVESVAFEAMKSEVASFFELDDYLNQFGIPR